MLYDIAFLLGGTTLVELLASIMGPIFSFVCSMGDTVGGSWDTFALLLEQILS